MSKIEAEPKGAAETASSAFDPPVGMSGWPGRNGERCSATQIGLETNKQSDHCLQGGKQPPYPTPGPPPP